MSVLKFTTIVIEHLESEFIIKCGRCRGIGENNREHQCRVCKGTGKVRLGIPSDWMLEGHDIGILKCGRCRGTGDNNREHFCSVCKGVGALAKCFPRVKCSRCNGTGDNNREHFCSSCGAVGSVWVGSVPKY
ncbi:MAG: hypothetical protein ACYTKD_18145 [Planctomycetota bacterium]